MSSIRISMFFIAASLIFWASSVLQYDPELSSYIEWLSPLYSTLVNDVDYLACPAFMTLLIQIASCICWELHHFPCIQHFCECSSWILRRLLLASKTSWVFRLIIHFFLGASFSSICGWYSFNDMLSSISSPTSSTSWLPRTQIFYRIKTCTFFFTMTKNKSNIFIDTKNLFNPSKFVNKSTRQNVFKICI